jgi:class 3 adenylate cyclase
LAAWSSLLLSALYTSLSLFQSLESAFTMVQFSSAIESLLLSFGLGYRFNLLKKEKYLVEKNLNENLRAKLHSYQQLEKVFYAHQISLIKDGHPLEKTMPTDGGTAAVISFDIIDSSKMVHEETNVFLRNIFHRCYEAMMRNYDPVALTANAYRIKELGDGFLCSVGYPFKTPNEQRKSITAMNLVREFQKIFEEEVAKLDYPRPVYFGIGIALGDIKGFYPEMGAKEYDLFGNGIVLATRYEAMRKELFKSRKKSSIIIVQERFFFSLTDEYRQDFECLDLSTTDFKVRDDPSAERLYFIPVDDALSRSSRKTG